MGHHAVACRHGGDVVVRHSHLGHHAVACRHGGDVVVRHSHLGHHAVACRHGGDVVVRHSHLGHHAVACRHGGDVVVWHNHFCRRAHLSVIVEKGHGLTRDHNHTRPEDVLIAAGWDRGKPAAFDATITSPLCPAM